MVRFRIYFEDGAKQGLMKVWHMREVIIPKFLSRVGEMGKMKGGLFRGMWEIKSFVLGMLF